MERDLATLLDIVLAGRALTTFVVGRARRDLDDDLMFRYAVLHAIALIGEAASRLSLEFRQAHPEVPWGEIIGTRNRILHGYDQVNLNIIWSIATENVEPLLTQLDPLLPEPPKSNERGGSAPS